MKGGSFSVTRAWNRLSIKYKIVIISASLITLRLFLNGNYFIGYQKLEAYHEFEHRVHSASSDLYNFKSGFTEIFFTDGALPQIRQSRQQLDKIVATFAALHQHHGQDMKFQNRIMELEKRAAQLRITASQVLEDPTILNSSDPEGMIILGRVTAMTNQLFVGTQQLIEDVTVYSGQMRDEIFNYMLTMGMVIFCVGILFLIMLYRGVMGPLKLLEEMRRLIRRVRTEGDLSGRLQTEDNNTEVGCLASDFNALISSLNNSLGKTAQTVNLVTEHVERLSHEVRESHDEISAQQHEIFHLNNSIRKMAETMQTLADNANNVAHSAEELGDHCREGEGILEEVRRISHSLDQHISSAMQQLEQIQGGKHSQAMQGDHGSTLSQLQYYSTEAANNIRFATEGLCQSRHKLEDAGRPTTMIRQLSESIGNCTQKILQTIETEREVLRSITRDVDEITSLENHAAFTSNLITSASDELLYLSKLLRSEVQLFHTTLEHEGEKHAS